MDSLQGRVILVTGGASGIGRQTCIDLAKYGAVVSICDANLEEAQKTASLILNKFANASAYAIKVDVTSAQEVENMVKVTVEKFGRLDGAVNCAGISGISGQGPKEIADHSDDRFDRVIAVNLKGVFLSMKHEIRQLLQQEKSKHFSIVNASSYAGLFGVPRIAAYVAAKHGVVGLTKTAALEYAQSGIRVNAVCPSYTDTPMIAHLPPERRVQAGASLPLGRLGTPEDISAAILWLLSDASSFVTGIALPLDGGSSAQ